MARRRTARSPAGVHLELKRRWVHVLGGDSYDEPMSTCDDLVWTPDGGWLLAAGLVIDDEFLAIPSDASWPETHVLTPAGKLVGRLSLRGALGLGPADRLAAGWRPRVGALGRRELRFADARPLEPVPGREEDVLLSRLAWSPRGTGVAGCFSRYAPARGFGVWHGSSGALLGWVRTPSEVLDVAWCPTGAEVATLTRDGQVRCWETERWAEAARWPVGEPVPQRALYWSATRISYSWDGRRLLVAGPGDEVAKVYGRDGARVRDLHGHGGATIDAVWSPDARLVATASQDHTIRVWDVATGGCAGRIEQPDCDRPQRLAWSPDGRTLTAICEAFGKYSLSIRAWSVKGTRPKPPSPARRRGDQALRWVPFGGDATDGVTAALSPAGDRLYVGAGAGRLWCWDLVRGEQVWEAELPERRNPPPPCHAIAPELAVSPDGERLVVGAQFPLDALEVRDAATGRLLRSLPLPPRLGKEPYSERPEWFGDRVLLRIHAANFVTVIAAFDPAAGELLWHVRGQHVRASAGAPDGHRVAVCWFVPGSYGHDLLRLYDGRTGKRLGRYVQGRYAALAWTPDARRVVASDSSSVECFDAVRREDVWLHQLGGYAGTQLTAWSPDGRRFACARGAHGLRLLDADGEVLATRKQAHTDELTGLAFSHDGALLVTCGEDQRVQAWDGRTLDPVARFRYPGGHPEWLVVAREGPVAVASPRGAELPVWRLDALRG